MLDGSARDGFFALIDLAVEELGTTKPKAITNHIIGAAFPKTLSSSKDEGCEPMLRNGVNKDVRTYLGHHPRRVDPRQSDFNEICPGSMPYQQVLGKSAFWLPDDPQSVTDDGEGEYVPVAELGRNFPKFRRVIAYGERKERYQRAENERLRVLLSFLEAEYAAGRYSPDVA